MFTCNSCMIQFQSSDLQRHHMKTEWHRYNLKRRVAQLAPISASLFAEKLQMSNREQELNQVDEFGFPVLKPINHSRGFQRKGRKLGRSRLEGLQHSGQDLRSLSPASSITSHASRATFRSTDLEEEAFSDHGFTTEDSYSHYSNTDHESSDESEIGNDHERISSTECIYCGKNSKQVEANVRHMFNKHGLYLPERSYLTDLTGLLKYLTDIIIVNKNCLCCKYQGSSVESIRAHMSSKHHCMLPYETKAERAAISQFYDFSSLDEAAVSDSSAKHGTSSSVSPVTFANSESIIQTAELHSSEDGADEAEADINSNYALVHIDDSGVELQLGNGIKVGHRSMQRYYRQNVPLGSTSPDDRRTVVAADRRVTSTVQSRQMKKAEKEIKQLEKQHSNKHVRLQIRRANHQTHFRDELLQ